MNTKIPALFVLASAFALSGAQAQNSSVVVPTSAVPSLSSPASAAPNQIVYTPRLPSAQELTNAAQAQGLSVDRIEQGGNQVLATYRAASGQVTVVSYQTLPPAGTATASATTAPQTVVVQPTREVYYAEPAYYPSYYYPGYYYPPVSLRVGVGYGWGWGGGFRGGFGGYHHR